MNAHFVVGTVAIVKDKAGRVLVTCHTYRGRRPWGLPGGWVKRGEDPADTIVREIREETGLEVEVTGLAAVQRERPQHLTVIYTARVTGGEFRASAEVIEAQFVEPGDWPAGMREDHQALVAAVAKRREVS